MKYSFGVNGFWVTGGEVDWKQHLQDLGLQRYPILSDRRLGIIPSDDFPDPLFLQ